MKKIFWLFSLLGALLLGLSAACKRRSPQANPLFIVGKRRIQKSPAMPLNTSALPAQNNSNIFSLLEERPQILLFLAFIFFSIFIGDFFRQYSHLFKASLLDLPQIEFTGTTFPVSKVPDWTQLSAAERSMSYDQIPQSKLIPLPKYNTNDFRKGMNYSTATDYQRNAYITFPVPNLGNYKLDGTENSGSHTGTDFKLPVGTPIASIANGVVYKTGYQKTGYGHFVVIAHTGVPDPKNPSQKTILFSNYAHLSKVLVREGQKVNKGAIIVKSGNSGTSTSPHLHFQIDTKEAPFHPYWPFTWNEVQDAGFNSSFEAVKYGVGKSNARKYTFHPIDFIVKNQNFSSTDNLIVSAEPTFIPDTKIVEPIVDSSRDVPVTENLKPSAPAIETKVEVVPETIEYKPVTKISKRGQLQVTFESDRTFTPGKEKTIKLVVNEPTFIASAGINLSSTVKDRAKITPDHLFPKDFQNGVAEIKVQSYSDYTFKLIAKGDFGEIKSSSLRAQVFADVPGSHTYGSAITYLKNNGIVNGYGDNTFRPDNNLNRAESVKIILTANDINTQGSTTTFTDVPKEAWFAPYIATAVANNIVKGYGDNQFKPQNTISRAEFLKIAIATAKIHVSENLSRNPYPDVQSDQWFAPYFQVAKEQELLRLKKGGFMAPHQPITRGEAADILYRISRL